MSTVTAVPLRPIAKGSLVYLWLAVALVLVAALGLARWGTSSFAPLGFKVIEEGTGASPTLTDIALVGYIGKLSNGTIFDQNPQAAMPVNAVVPGFSQALQKMKKGGHYELTIPPRLGYGFSKGPVPAGSTLHFDVKLLDFKSEAEVRQMMQLRQQLQGMQQQTPRGMPPGAMPPGAVPPGGMPPEAAPTQ